MHNAIYSANQLELYLDKDNQVTTDFNKAVLSLDLSAQFQDQLADLALSTTVTAKRFTNQTNAKVGYHGQPNFEKKVDAHWLSYGCYFYTTNPDQFIHTYLRNGSSGYLDANLVYPPRPQGNLPSEVKVDKITFANLQKPIWAFERLGSSPFYDHTPIVHLEGEYENGSFVAAHDGEHHAIVSFHLSDTALFCMSINNFLTESTRFNENGWVNILDEKQYQCFQELSQFFEQRGGGIGIDYRTDSRVLQIINKYK